MGGRCAGTFWGGKRVWRYVEGYGDKEALNSTPPPQLLSPPPLIAVTRLHGSILALAFLPFVSPHFVVTLLRSPQVQTALHSRPRCVLHLHFCSLFALTCCHSSPHRRYKTACKAEVVFTGSAMGVQGVKELKEWIVTKLPEGPTLYHKVGRRSWVAPHALGCLKGKGDP